MAAGKQKFKGVKLLTEEGRVSFPAVFKPVPKYQKSAADGIENQEYKVTLLFSKSTDMNGFKKACADALNEVFGSKDKWPKDIMFPFKDQAEEIERLQDKGKDYSHLEVGALMASFKTNAKNGAPAVAGPDGKVIPDTDANTVYGGCYGRVKCQLVVNQVKTGKNTNTYVTAYLSGLQKTKDGNSFGGRENASDMFEPVTFDATEGNSAIDPLS